MTPTEISTESNREVGTSQPGTVHVERETPDQFTEFGKSEVTERYSVRGLLKIAQSEFDPPNVLTETPRSVKALRAYARQGAWTKRADGPLRFLGTAWWYAIGLPVTVACRYVEWTLQRPGRAVTAYVLWWLFINHGPGPWIADHIFRPLGALFAWILL